MRVLDRQNYFCVKINCFSDETYPDKLGRRTISKYEILYRFIMYKTNIDLSYQDFVKDYYFTTNCHVMLC